MTKSVYQELLLPRVMRKSIFLEHEKAPVIQNCLNDVFQREAVQEIDAFLFDSRNADCLVATGLSAKRSVLFGRRCRTCCGAGRQAAIERDQYDH